MRVLVTGGAGFFGSRLPMHLDGCEVHVTDAPSASRQRFDALASGRATYHVLDLLDREAAARMVRELRPDAVVHLAWYAVPGKYLAAVENLDHLRASLDLLRILSEVGCKRLLTAGTCFEYDTDIGLLSETSATRPRFLYAAAKLALGEVAREACRAFGMSHAHLRFFYPYGPWEAPGRLVPAVVTPLLRGEEARVTAGEQVRDYLHIDDVARAVAIVLSSNFEGVVNVGSGVEVRVCDVVGAVARACGREDLVRYGALPTREGDPQVVCADVGRLRSLGFVPKFGLEAGIEDTVAWYRSGGWSA